MFVCDVCDKEYSSYKSKWLHNKKYHSENNIIVDTSVKCDHCNKILKNKYLLKNYLLIVRRKTIDKTDLIKL
jgi:hypothetical protein